jgi:hypothetical protein
MSGITQLERAAAIARSMGEFSERTDGFIGLVALALVQVMKSSPDDQADWFEHIAKAARRS